MHLFANANRCDLAQVEEVQPSNEHPDGLRFLSPCACPRFLQLVHDTTEPGPADSGGKPTFITVRHKVSGCFYRLYPWMQRGAIVQIGSLLSETTALRADVQSLEVTVRKRSAVNEDTFIGFPANGLLGLLSGVATAESTQERPIQIGHLQSGALSRQPT